MGVDYNTVDLGVRVPSTHDGSCEFLVLYHSWDELPNAAWIGIVIINIIINHNFCSTENRERIPLVLK